MSYIGVGESEVPMAPLNIDGDEPGGQQFREMRPDGLLGDAGDARKARSP